MKGKRRTLFVRAPLVAVFALAAGVVLSAGTASAKYMSDGAAQNTGGGWNLPTDFVCIVGVHMDGTLDVADGVTNRNDCAYLQTGTMNGGTAFNLTTLNTTAKCNNVAGGDGAKHTWTTSGICSVPLTGLDRTRAMCVAKGGTWTPSPTGVCVAYGAQFKGQNAAGAPLAWNTGASGGTAYVAGTTGYCYAVMNMTSAGYIATTCPMAGMNDAPNAAYANDSSTAYDWSWGPESTRSPKCAAGMCCYAKAISGYLPAALTKADGTTYTAGTFLDMSTFTTMGDCLANGGSWNNWTGSAASSTTTLPGGVSTTPLLASIPVWNYTTQVPDADEGCLHCHSNTVQYNGPAERWKDSYLQTGHKNMLRKVNQSVTMPWAGPNGAIYTVDSGSRTINFTAPPTVNGGALYFIFGDWMAALPETVGPSGGYTAYSCGACHTAGFKDATNPGVQGIGTTGYTPASPAAPYNANVAAGHKWDLEGIQCSRCHNATVAKVSQGQITGGSCGYSTSPQCAAAGGSWSGSSSTCSINAGEIYLTSAACTATTPVCVGGSTPGKACAVNADCAPGTCTGAPIARGTWTAATQATLGSSFPSTHPTSGGMGALAAGTGRTNLCFGCHQSIAKAWPAGTTQYDPTLIPTGVSHGAQAGRDFNGHVLGNSFLNSVHGEYAGVNSNTLPGGIRLNALGKYDLVDPSGTSEYASLFKGYTCWQTATGNSPAKTRIDPTLTTPALCAAADGEWEPGNVCVKEIKTKAECDAVYACTNSGAPVLGATQATCLTPAVWASTWRADATGDLGTKQGSCATCHDVHNSLFVASQEEKALRKTCQDCHVNNATTGATDINAPQVVVANINHLTGAGTPFDTTLYENSCIVCHMAQQAEENGDQNSLPVHLWRININPSYSTFPTTAQFYGGSCDVHTGAVQNAPKLPVVYLSDTSLLNCNNATPVAGNWTVVTKDRNAQVAPDGTYTNAAWVDLDLACGQCHGGSLGFGQTHNGALYREKGTLAAVAEGMHQRAATTYSVTFSTAIGTGVNSLRVDVAGSVACTTGCPTFTYDWDWGDATAHGSGQTANHTYASAGTKSITLTVSDTVGVVGSTSRSVTVTVADLPPTASGTCTWDANTWTMSVLDTSTDDHAVQTAVVVWGDSTSNAVGAGGSTFTHTYLTPGGPYTPTVRAIDASLQSNGPTACTGNTAVSAAYFAISGTVFKHNGTTPVPSAAVTVKKGSAAVKTVYTLANGTFSAGSLKPGTYTLVVTKAGYTFTAPAATITVGPTSSGNNISAVTP